MMRLFKINMPSNMRRFGSLIMLFLMGFANAIAQTDSLRSEKPVITIQAYADVFYAYDFNLPDASSRQPFFYHHNRHNEFNLNHGILKMSVSQPGYRANVALHAGTYVNDNYATEPEALQSIYEANIGLALNKDHSLWLDAGVMSSHIGFESALSIQNWTLTRSILAENSPYYMAGARLGWTPSPKWDFGLLLFNGWQHIQRIQGNSLPALGTQIRYLPNSNSTFNYSTFIGSEFPDTSRRMRYFNNLYWQRQHCGRFGYILGLDFGWQQEEKGSSGFQTWFSPVFILKYSISDTWSAAFRAEYYEDETGIIIPESTPNGFKTSGLSLNLDYLPMPGFAWRIEGRWLQSQDAIFTREQELVRNDVFIVTSLAYTFGSSF